MIYILILKQSQQFRWLFSFGKFVRKCTKQNVSVSIQKNQTFRAWGCEIDPSRKQHFPSRRFSQHCASFRGKINRKILPFGLSTGFSWRNVFRVSSGIFTTVRFLSKIALVCVQKTLLFLSLKQGAYSDGSLIVLIL